MPLNQQLKVNSATEGLITFQTYIADLLVLDGSQQLHPPSQESLILFSHLFQFYDLRPVTANEKVDVGTHCTDFGEGTNQKIDTFAVHKATDADDVDWKQVNSCQYPLR